jgi:hypothetical protein
MKILLAATLSTISFAPPANLPSYWTEPNDRNIAALLDHCQKADDITAEDCKLVFTLISKSIALDVIKEYVDIKIKEEPERRMSWDDVKFELDKCEKTLMKEMKKRYDEDIKRNNQPQNPVRRDA